MSAADAPSAEGAVQGGSGCVFNGTFTIWSALPGRLDWRRFREGCGKPITHGSGCSCRPFSSRGSQSTGTGSVGSGAGWSVPGAGLCLVLVVSGVRQVGLLATEGAGLSGRLWKVWTSIIHNPHEV